VIQEATTDEEIASTFSVMRQLRLHLAEDECLETIKRMQRRGYRLAAVTECG
jgi:hypothetical protein